MVRRISSSKSSHRGSMSRSEAGRLGAEARWGAHHSETTRRGHPSESSKRMHYTTTSSRHISRHSAAPLNHSRSSSRNHRERELEYAPMSYYENGYRNHHHRDERDSHRMPHAQRNRLHTGARYEYDYDERPIRYSDAGYRGSKSGYEEARGRAHPSHHGFEESSRRAHSNHRGYEDEPYYTFIYEEEPMVNSRSRSSYARMNHGNAHNGRATGRTATASRTARPATASRAGRTATASRTGRTATASRTGRTATASRTGRTATASRTARTATASRTGRTSTASRTARTSRTGHMSRSEAGRRGAEARWGR